VVKPLSKAVRSTRSAEPFQQLIAGYELAAFDVGNRGEKLRFFFRRQIETFLVASKQNGNRGALGQGLALHKDFPSTTVPVVTFM
jgi:hypothetical protein